jgi:transposase
MVGYFELHHNAPIHTVLSVREFLAKKCISVLPQAHYSPDFSPCGIYLFPKLKSRFKSYHFQASDSAQKAVTDVIKTLTEADFQSCFEV